MQKKPSEKIENQHYTVKPTHYFISLQSNAINVLLWPGTYQ